VRVCVCLCVCECVYLFTCVCVGERKREKERESIICILCVTISGEMLCSWSFILCFPRLCVYMCVHACVCVYVCVCARLCEQGSCFVYQDGRRDAVLSEL